ncbi:hypothetical protein HPT25_04615 [Bacillus sp. BRMEA1]|uniref:methyl-accepting chemotaxis protein n=1 Tax=Neobacillus endophyticus TaxID=2738405 RepID=UPI0015674D9A|nr:methyl-accepting chemotaxis protein [Neobacillus endophyticus]NRD76773.1 hypothetical protein [Neobacillus endophyticus]
MNAAAEASNIMAGKVQKISAYSKVIAKNVENVYQVIKSFQDIANQSNILGLNATIKAARADDYGRVFTCSNRD